MEVENICHKAMEKAENLNLSKAVFKTGRKVIYIAPTQIQAREIVWAALKYRLHGLGTPNEQKLHMVVPNADGTKSTIMVGGYENRENYRGLTDVVHITFDETDTFKNFFIAWLDIFRPLFLDTGGTANFIGTPKKENPNLRRLEKEAEGKPDWSCHHFTSRDNPHISEAEIDALADEYKGNPNSYKQEVLAEHVEDVGALFRYSSIVDTFTNTVPKENDRYLIVDIADDGSDKSVFSFWDGLEEYRREEYQGLNTEALVAKIREYAVAEQIPHSHIAVDAIGVGAGVASASLLDGVIGYKSSYSPIKTDMDIVRLPNVGYTEHARLTSDYKNLRSQCVFTLAELVNTHKIASRVDGQFKELIIEELQAYQDASKGDGKRFATPKEDVKEMIGRSPDHSDTWIMRMYFVVMGRMAPEQSEQAAMRREKMLRQMQMNRSNFSSNSTR